MYLSFFRGCIWLSRHLNKMNPLIPNKIKEGDILKCTANTEHWHSSSKHQDVTYLAVYKGETEWTEVLSQEAYDDVSLLLNDN